MESSSCLCLRVNFFGNHGDHNVFVAPADNHVQGAFLLNDVADVVGGDHRLSIDADDDIIFLETPTATQRKCDCTVSISPGVAARIGEQLYIYRGTV